jgi:hypothetical protein
MPIVAPSISLMAACILSFNYILVGWANDSIVNPTLSNLNVELRKTCSPTYATLIYYLTLRSNVALVSFTAPSTAGFVGISPKGRGMPRVGRRVGSPLYRPPTKPRSAGSSGNRAAFSLDTFFWRSKRKYLAFGCEYPIKKTVATATSLFVF